MSRLRQLPRAEAAAVGALAVLAVVAWALAPSTPSYDGLYHLVWGEELLRGEAPSFAVDHAPTQHPLYVLLGAALVPFGDGADRVLVLVVVLAHVAVLWGTFRFGARALTPAAGLAGAVLFGASLAALLWVARAYVDVPFLALVVWAAVVAADAGEDGRPRRPGLVIALLAVAGLLRPDAWVFAGLVWLWCLPGRPWSARARLAALVAVAPVLWVLSDLVVTGDPLFSLTSTSSDAEALGRERGLDDVPRVLVEGLAANLRSVVVLAALAGAVLLLRRPADDPRWPDVRRAAVPLALVAAGVLVFAAQGLAGTSLLPRYLAVPSVALALLAGHALTAFLLLPRSRLRTALTATVVLVVAVGIAVTAVQLPRSSVRDEVAFLRDTRADLRALLRDPEVRAACAPLSFPTWRLVPDARLALGGATEDEVVARSDPERRPDRGVHVVLTGGEAERRYGRAPGVRGTNVPPRGGRLVAEAGDLQAWAACG